MEKKVEKKDIILIGIVVLIAILALLGMKLTKREGTQVVITIDGEVYGTYDLDKDEIIYLEVGDGMNTVRIQDKSVCMTEASCPDQICVHSHALAKEYPGTIVCLPHKVVVSVGE